ncbi:hypothetical protein DFH09DRAFT_1504208 [Mycena vulgaris]|nr:hypothetical protein DFH09DRAFT_1504208 [Mycena vulgaris]
MPGSYTLGTEWRAAVFLLCAPPHMQRTAPREWNDRTIIPETPGEQNGRGETGEPQLFSPPLPFTARQMTLWKFQSAAQLTEAVSEPGETAIGNHTMPAAVDFIEIARSSTWTSGREHLKQSTPLPPTRPFVRTRSSTSDSAGTSPPSDCTKLSSNPLLVEIIPGYLIFTTRAVAGEQVVGQDLCVGTLDSLEKCWAGPTGAASDYPISVHDLDTVISERVELSAYNETLSYTTSSSVVVLIKFSPLAIHTLNVSESVGIKNNVHTLFDPQEETNSNIPNLVVNNFYNIAREDCTHTNAEIDRLEEPQRTLLLSKVPKQNITTEHVFWKDYTIFYNRHGKRIPGCARTDADVELSMQAAMERHVGACDTASSMNLSRFPEIDTDRAAQLQKWKPPWILRELVLRSRRRGESSDWVAPAELRRKRIGGGPPRGPREGKKPVDSVTRLAYLALELYYSFTT